MEADDPFYKGKRLTLLINFAAGGPSDIEGRLLAKHFGKHIDGAPQHHRAEPRRRRRPRRHQLSRRARAARRHHGGLSHRRGLELRDRSRPLSASISRPTSSSATQPGNAVYYMRADTPARDEERGRPHQGQGPGRRRSVRPTSSKDLLIRLTLDMLGVPYKYVTGFRSSAPARLALQRGEINFFSESSPAYFGVVEPTLVKTGQVIPVCYDPTTTARPSARRR